MEAAFRMGRLLSDHLRDLAGPVLDLRDRLYRETDPCEEVVDPKKEEPKLPPHEQAIKELDEIKQQKLWQQGRSKEYYTLITDTLRKYIEERFGINAMEMTSGEILELIRKNSEAQSVYDNLRQILQLADFVKFAKMNPLPDENDLSMMNAYLFVNQTKVEEMQEPESTNDTTNLKD